MTVLFAFIVGIFLGVIFFAGLWFTISFAIKSKYPAIWFPLSLLLRVGIVLLGFYYVADGQIINILICLAGFLLARVWIQRQLKSAGRLAIPIKTEGHD